MSTRNRRKRNQKPSKRWREFMMMPGPTVDAALDVVPIMWMATHGIPSFAGAGIWETAVYRHAL